MDNIYFTNILPFFNVVMASDNTKYCTKCRNVRPVADFVRTRGQKTQSFSVCNICSMNAKQQRSGSSLNVNTDTHPPSSSHVDIEMAHEESDNDDFDGLIYNVSEIETVIRDKFANSSAQPIAVCLKVELEDEMVGVHLTDINQYSESAIAQEIAKHLQIHLEKGSAYYWEIRRVHVNKKVGNPTGMVTVYFGCVQREERQFSRSNDGSTKHEREVIGRYPCKGSVTMKIDSTKRMP